MYSQSIDDIICLDGDRKSCKLKVTPSAVTIVHLTNDSAVGRESSSSIPILDIIGVHHQTKETRNRAELLVVKLHLFRNNAPYKRKPQTQPSFGHVVLSFTFQYGDREPVFGALAQLKQPLLRSVSHRFNKPLLIMINSFGGAGKAVKLFDTVIKPALTAASVPYEVEVTQSATYATDWARDADLRCYAGIAIMSGDGLINQVVRGLIARLDWSSAVKTPLAFLPAGTYNALAEATLYESSAFGSDHVVRAATYVLLRHRVSELDIILVETRNERLYAVLMLAWGFIANWNNDAANYRWMGPFRTVFTFLKRLRRLPAYGCRIDFLPFDEHQHIDSRNDELEDVVESAPKRRFLPPITESVPSDWQTLRGRFAGVMPWKGAIFSNLLITPEAKLNDGAMYLFVFKDGLSGWEFGRIMGKLKQPPPNYRIQDESLIEVYKVVAFRVTPDDDSAGLCIDGEVLKSGPFQAEVIQGLGRVMLRN